MQDATTATAAAPAPAAGTRTPPMSERRTSLIAALLVALGPVSMSLYTPAMPELVHAFQTSETVVKSTLTAYFGGFAFAQLVAGPVSDAFGRRKAALGFLAIYLAGSLIAALAPSIGMLLAARLIQGIGAAVGVTVSRAIVRDQHTGEKAARIMNLVAIMLAIAPAMAPTIGGITLALSGWHAIFLVMIGFGLAIVLVVQFLMAETITPDPSRVRPGRVLAAYGRLLSSGEFVSAALVVACGAGALYALATILPFVLIERVGLTPTEFGFSMVMQSGAYFFGSIAARIALRRISARQAILPGLALLLAGCVILLVGIGIAGPSFATVMVPVAFYAFGIAFVMPYMMLAGLMPFPEIAGSAAAMTGFFQMGTGFLGGTIGAALGDPVTALVVVLPAMGLSTAGGYLWYATLMRGRRAEA